MSMDGFGSGSGYSDLCMRSNHGMNVHETVSSFNEDNSIKENLTEFYTCDGHKVKTMAEVMRYNIHYYNKMVGQKINDNSESNSMGR